MSRWRSARAARVLAALLRLGWRVRREAKGSHKVLVREGYPDFVYFKQLVQLRRIRGFHAVKVLRGYPLIEIRSPREVIDDEA